MEHRNEARPVVIVRGTGDVGSAVAHVLLRQGYAVILHDVPHPAHSRRDMAFTNAAYGETVELSGVLAKPADSPSALHIMLECHRAIPVVTTPIETLLAEIQTDALVDARMRKRTIPERQRALVPLTIGLGPNFVAGDQVDLVIETSWGDRLGQVIRSGGSLPLSGDPREMGGYTRERCVYSPVAGTFETSVNIGDRVRQGDPVGSIGHIQILAPLSGHLRGLAHTGATVLTGTKIVEIDPRPDALPAVGLGERPLRIAAGVLAALQPD
jgi:xanthine dehydrogenase accessory factor